MPAAASSSARGGRNSTVKSGVSAPSAATSAFAADGTVRCVAPVRSSARSPIDVLPVYRPVNMSPVATALATLMALPIVKLAPHATPVDDMVRLRAALGASCPRLLIKRDDLLSFAMGGNKVRKMQAVAAEALAGGADMLITCGGVQSNHARVTAATGAVLGLSVVLVLNGEPQSQP